MVSRKLLNMIHKEEKCWFLNGLQSVNLKMKERLGQTPQVSPIIIHLIRAQGQPLSRGSSPLIKMGK